MTRLCCRRGEEGKSFTTEDTESTQAQKQLEIAARSKNSGEGCACQDVADFLRELAWRERLLKEGDTFF
jgi:hypothetical protein